MRRVALLLTLVFVFGCDTSDRTQRRGEACDADGACEGLSCVVVDAGEAVDLAPAELRCDDLREGGGPGEACEHADQCDHGVCVLAGACALPCASADDCGEAERCQEIFLRAADDVLQPVQACVAMVDLPPDADVQVELREGVLGGEEDRIGLGPIEAGADTTIVLQHSASPWPDGVLCRPPLCVSKLETDGDPAVLFDNDLDYSLEAAPLAPVARGDHVDPAVVRIDRDLAEQLDGAELTVTLTHESAGDLRVTRIRRATTGQRLDLNVFYLGALEWRPTGSRGPELLARALEVVDGIFEPADVFIGEVRQIHVGGELPMLGVSFPEGGEGAGFAVLEPRFGVYVELPELFRLSAGAANTAVNLFFVSDIRPRGGGGEPLAEAGGIPGPPGMHGTAGSGIAIATDMMSGDAEGLGRTIAHELAHYLGLFHTTESTGVVLESLADTPECRPGDDCTGHESNLMWWAKTTGTELSEAQVGVLGRAAVLQ